MAMPYRTLDRMAEPKRATILREARAFLEQMDQGVPVQRAQPDLFG